VASGPRHGGGGRGRLHLIALALTVQLGLAGCYNYARVQPGAVPAGSEVRVRVSDGVRLNVGEIPLLQDGGTVEGKVMRTPTADTLYCDVLVGVPADGEVNRGLRGTVSIPAGAVESVEVRRLDKLRTGGLVGVGVALAWMVVDASFNINNPNPPVDEPGGVNNARITLFQLRR
jgi:hypothetical protein